MIGRQDVIDKLEDMVKRHPQSRANFRRVIREGAPGAPDAKDKWDWFLGELSTAQITSVATSKTGNTLILRVKGSLKHNLRIGSSFRHPIEIVCDLADAIWDKMAPRDLVLGTRRTLEYNASSTSGAVEYGGYMMAGGFALLEALQLAKVWAFFHRCLEAVDKAQTRALDVQHKHAKKLAIGQMLGLVRTFLANGGSYEEMVELLKKEVVSSVQDE